MRVTLESSLKLVIVTSPKVTVPGLKKVSTCNVLDTIDLGTPQLAPNSFKSVPLECRVTRPERATKFILSIKVRMELLLLENR